MIVEAQQADGGAGHLEAGCELTDVAAVYLDALLLQPVVDPSVQHVQLFGWIGAEAVDQEGDPGPVREVEFRQGGGEEGVGDVVGAGQFYPPR